MYHGPRLVLFSLALGITLGSVIAGGSLVRADGPDSFTQVFTFGEDGVATSVTITTEPVSETQPEIAVAVVTDQNRNPRPGQPVTFFSFDPSRFVPVCATTLSLLAAGLAFVPLIPGAFPPPAAPPQAGFPPNPGAGLQAGQTTLGAPFPLPTATVSTLQATPLGYTCFSGTALGGATGLGTVPPGAVTVLTDATGAAFIGLAPIPRP